MVMMSSVYASLLALLIVWLSFHVIKIRRSRKIRLGDGGDPDLQAAIRAQGNATEYIPMSIILLMLLELGGGNAVLIHLGGLTLVSGRLIHARGLIADNLQYRVLGMRLTFYALIGLAAANLGYAAYSAYHAQ